jgi:hypothetical protein
MFFRSVRANRRERSRALPGDQLVVGPAVSATHAVTIRRPPRDVWPWLVQMGAGRAGWYSYDFIDNGGHRSAERIVPELQYIAVGSLLPALPRATDGFFVFQCEAERTLVLGPVPEPGLPPTATWSFVLDEAGPNRTRLMVRGRLGAGRPGNRPYGLPPWLLRLVGPLGHFVMERKQLLGIARRAENGGATTPAGTEPDPESERKGSP